MDYYVLGLAIWEDPFCIWGCKSLLGQLTLMALRLVKKRLCLKALVREGLIYLCW